MDDPTVPLRTVAENNLAIAFLTKTPIVPGHVLVCPKRMVSKSMELSFDEWKAILELKTIICSQLKNVFNAEGFNFAWNEGKNAGQSVPHFHLHILPRKEGDAGVYQYEPRVFLYRPGTRATSPQEELSSLANMLRKNSIKVRK
ncbi:MAG: HIT domain-containing protein [Parachlamydiales bacterium]|nr:HIT domain-containing protein [Parachlamydiales bacterium]